MNLEIYRSIAPKCSLYRTKRISQLRRWSTIVPNSQSIEVEQVSPKAKEATGTHPLSVLGEALESAAESFGDATSNARASAKVAARKVRSTVGTGVYKSAYGVSYGVVFGGVFLKELLPENNTLRRGFEEGAEAAFDAVANRKLEAASGSKRSVGSRKKSKVKHA
jgi:hypothetical protein